MSARKLDRRRWRLFDAHGRHLRDVSALSAREAVETGTRTAARCGHPWPAPGEAVFVSLCASRGHQTVGPQQSVTVPLLRSAASASE